MYVDLCLYGVCQGVDVCGVCEVCIDTYMHVGM